MTETKKISIVEWWKYERSVFLKACHETSKASFGRGLFASILALIGQWMAGLRNKHDTLLIILISLGAGVLVFLVEFAFKFFRAPGLLSKIDKEKIDGQKREFDNEKERLESIINLLQKPSAPTLEIEIIHPGKIDLITGRRTYRIKVKNTHISKSVKNLKVVLCEIKWPRSMQKPLNMDGIIWPHQLPEKGNQNNSLLHELSGDSEKEFDLMFVSLTKSKRVINLAPFLPMKNVAPSFVGLVYSNISFNIEYLPIDDSKIIFKFKVSGGDGDVDTITESCVLNVPPLLPENDMKNQIENINALNQNLEKYLPFFEKS